MRTFLVLIIAIAFAAAATALWGALSAIAFIALMGPILIGAAAGAGAGFAALITGSAAWRRVAFAAWCAALLGMAATHGIDDWRFQDAYTLDYADARYVASGAPAELAPGPDERAFYGPGAQRSLARTVRKDVGFDGPAGRWWYRAQEGIRLLGPWTASRGLAVGPWGALIWALMEFVLALFVATNVLKRVRDARPIS